MATGPHPASDPFPHAAVKQQREGVPRVPGPGNPLAQPEPGAAAWPNSVAARYAANLTQSRRQHQVAEDLAGGGVDDGDVEVLDEQDDVGSGVGSADADVAQSSGHAQGDAAGLIDLSCRVRSWVSVLRSLLGVALGSEV